MKTSRTSASASLRVLALLAASLTIANPPAAAVQSPNDWGPGTPYGCQIQAVSPLHTAGPLSAIATLR